MSNDRCPHLKDLFRLLRGEQAAATLAMSQHVDDCAHCRSALRAWLDGEADFDTHVAEATTKLRSTADSEEAHPDPLGEIQDSDASADSSLDLTPPAINPASEHEAAAGILAGPAHGVGGLSPADLRDAVRATSETLSAGVATSAGTRFRVLRQHARGGLGEVFVARDEEFGREVALKQIQTKFADHRESRARFTMEAEITGGLEHPGIVPVYGLGHDSGGRPFYAMRLIRGDTLRDAITRFHGSHDESGTGGKKLSRPFHSMEFRKLLRRLVDVCQAVHYAHSRGVIHRDLKPSNIMLGKYGETLVVDWGLAKAVRSERSTDAVLEEAPLTPRSQDNSPPTEIGAAMGTPTFMSPEQASGRIDKLGPESDIYSLGATLYNLLTGKAAFAGRDTGKILQRVIQGDFCAPRQIDPAIPRPLEAVCLKAMARDPQQRYRTAAEISDDVERYLADEPVTAETEPIVVRTQRWLRKHQSLSIAAASVVMVSLMGMAVFSTIVSRKNGELAAANRSEREARALAETNEQVARKQSESNLATLTTVIKNIDGLKKVAGAGPVRRQLLTRSLDALEELPGQYVAQGSVDRNVMLALTEMGEVILQLGDDTDSATSPPSERAELESEEQAAVALARALFSRARDIAEQLAQEDRTDAQAQTDLSVAYNKLGNVSLRSGSASDALDAYRQSREVAERIVRRNPTNVQPLSIAGPGQPRSWPGHRCGGSRAAKSRTREASSRRGAVKLGAPAGLGDRLPARRCCEPGRR